MYRKAVQVYHAPRWAPAVTDEKILIINAADGNRTRTVCVTDTLPRSYKSRLVQALPGVYLFPCSPEIILGIYALPIRLSVHCPSVCLCTVHPSVCASNWSYVRIVCLPEFLACPCPRPVCALVITYIVNLLSPMCISYYSLLFLQLSVCKIYEKVQKHAELHVQVLTPPWNQVNDTRTWPTKIAYQLTVNVIA